MVSNKEGILKASVLAAGTRNEPYMYIYACEAQHWKKESQKRWVSQSSQLGARLSALNRSGS